MNLEKKIREEMYEYMKEVVSKLNVKILNKTVSPRDFSVVLMLYPIIHEYFNVGMEWEEFVYEICLYFKHEIENNRISDISAFSGLGEIAFGIKCYSNYTGKLVTFSNQVDELLYIKLEKHSEFLFNNSIVSMSEYDIIGGISGIALYLSKYYDKQFPNTVKYLCSLFEVDKDGDINIRVLCEQQFLEKEKIDFPEGHMNFGLSHGILGPLLALSEIYKNIDEINLRCSIIKIIKFGLAIYEKYSYIKNEVIKWPSQLDYRKFSKGITIREKDVYNYPSWCYGYVSISNSINRICNTTHVEFNGHLTIDMNKQMNELRQIIEEKDISLCHGIAGEILFLSLVGDNEIIDTKIELMLRIIRNNSNEKFYYRKKYSLISNSEDFSVFKGHPENLNILEGTGGIFLLFSKLLYSNSEIEELLFLR